ncbi:transporter, major facilitator family protein [Ancylostoma caninum]|uniref:Transporter, major facilitator family protein n=1 Tax=Ancylostoma caninum TaxID=29170 RepID=A0A368GFA5_ANCCA|nr:transporter, major facilitator family protein [Ancylostoma caninum]
MDRFTIAGVLTNIQAYFRITDAEAGLLQSVFIVFYMFCSPICGFLGDRYDRKLIMLVGIFVWIAAVFASTFISSDKFWLFLLLRGIVGIGEASYVTVAPTMIADMFTGSNRSRMLMIFYFAIPFGSGLGFIVGSRVAALTGRWEWGVRVSVIFGIICLAMIIFFIDDPERGAAEREKGEMANTLVASSYTEDIKALVTNLTYVFASCGFTAIVFTVGTLSWWMPTTIEHSIAHGLGLNSTAMLDSNVKAQTNLVFGIITCLGGIICLAMIIFFIDDPERGAAEREKGEMANTLVASSYTEDIKALVTNLTYVFASCGFTAIVFTVGTLSWWMPTTIEHSIAHGLGLNSTAMLDSNVKAQTNLVFGIITCLGGIVGVALGSILSMMLRSGYGPFKLVRTVRSDPIICGVGAFIGVPAMYFSLHLIEM